MQVRHEYLKEKMLVGMQASMSISENKTFDLFSRFMPMRKAIVNGIATHVFDLRIYPERYFLNFNPKTNFIKWAAIEVTEKGEVPEGMEHYKLPGGKYVVFDQDVKDSNSPYQYIFDEWLPQSGHLLDDRPHFEILSGMTKKNDPNTQQEIWVPIK